MTTNPYTPPREVEAKKVKPIHVGHTGAGAFVLACVHAVALFAVLEWIFYFEVYSYTIAPENYWMENLRHFLRFLTLAPIGMAVLQLITPTPVWGPVGVSLVWMGGCGYWLFHFLRDCVKRGGDHAITAFALLFLFSQAISIASHWLSVLHHREQVSKAEEDSRPTKKPT